MVQKSGDHQLRLVVYHVYPTIYEGFYTSQMVIPGFLNHQQYVFKWSFVHLPPQGQPKKMSFAQPPKAIPKNMWHDCGCVFLFLVCKTLYFFLTWDSCIHQWTPWGHGLCVLIVSDHLLGGLFWRSITWIWAMKKGPLGCLGFIGDDISYPVM